MRKITGALKNYILMYRTASLRSVRNWRSSIGGSRRCEPHPSDTHKPCG